jgi:hypothetical protein
MDFSLYWASLYVATGRWPLMGSVQKTNNKQNKGPSLYIDLNSQASFSLLICDFIEITRKIKGWKFDISHRELVPLFGAILFKITSWAFPAENSNTVLLWKTKLIFTAISQLFLFVSSIR